MVATAGEWLAFLFGDAVLLYAFQAVVFLFLIYAELRNRGYFEKPSGFRVTVKRGEESWNILNLAFGIVAINLLQVINSADDATRFKVLMSFFDLLVAIRLFFFNGWFRNKVICVVIKARALEEGKRP